MDIPNEDTFLAGIDMGGWNLSPPPPPNKVGRYNNKREHKLCYFAFSPKQKICINPCLGYNCSLLVHFVMSEVGQPLYNGQNMYSWSQSVLFFRGSTVYGVASLGCVCVGVCVGGGSNCKEEFIAGLAS